MIKLEDQEIVGEVAGLGQVQLDGAALERRLDPSNVVHRMARRVVLAIGRGKGRSITPREVVARLLPVGLDEGLVQPIGPGARGLREARFDVADLVGRDVLRAGAGHEMDARQRRLGERDVEVHFEGVDGLAQDRLHALAEIGVVTITRHEHQAR